MQITFLLFELTFEIVKMLSLSTKIESSVKSYTILPFFKFIIAYFLLSTLILAYCSPNLSSASEIVHEKNYCESLNLYE